MSREVKSHMLSAVAMQYHSQIHTLGTAKFVDENSEMVEFNSKDNNNNIKEEDEKQMEPLDTEAITKEEEWITKRKTELTTTRQIETRVKRQVVLEDGKVVEDSGPIVSTNTTEDTDKQETETTEKRDLGIPQKEDDELHQVTDALRNTTPEQNKQETLAELDEEDGGGGGGKLLKEMVARPADGLVRESNDKRVISHEEVKDYLETEDVKHLGDFSDETYVQAVNSGADNLEEVLLSPASQQQLLVPLGPRIVKQTSKARKTIDSENVQKRCLAQDDGTLITESRKTTEHEIIADEDIPEGNIPVALRAGSNEKLYSREAKQRYFKQRDEQNVDLLLDGKVVDSEMRYAAETSQMEKEGSLERSGDWDSLSDRMRKMRSRTHQKSIMQQHKEAALLADRKDALTKRPLDFDREEETRKGETMKWLESHFGSESTASNDSREDVEQEIEPTKKTYFNVTIKSGINYIAPQPIISNGNKTPNMTHTTEYKYSDHNKLASNNGNKNNNNNNNKYYQGISNWSDRKEVAPMTKVTTKSPLTAATAKSALSNHFSSKAFRDDLQMTVERNRLRRNGGSREHLTSDFKDNNYVNREDILQQKRQSLSAQYLARSRRDSREQLDERSDSSPMPHNRDKLNLSNSRTDLRNNKLEPRRPSYIRANTMDINGISGHRHSLVQSQVTTPRTQDYVDVRAKSYDRELNEQQHESRTMKYTRRTPSPEPIRAKPPNGSSSSTLVRPSVPQRRRAIEKKLHQQHSASKPLKVVQLAEGEERGIIEPPPDYSPPPRSRSSSPPLDYARGQSKSYNDAIEVNTLQRKQNQRTRFAPATQRQTMSTQTTQTPPSNISTSTTATSQKSTRRVGQVIGNSLRKLVNKIRSASAERKLRMKSKSKSREQSPVPPMLEHQNGLNNDNMSTYQQYNRQIDSHIGGQGGSNESERENSCQAEMSLKLERESAPPTFQGARRRESADSENITNPRQRYYLGEDPYSSTLYGKENIYDPESLAKRQRATRKQIHEVVSNGVHHESRRDEVDYNNQQQRTQASTHTLGRYQKSNNRYAGSTPNLSQPDYRSTQTLPKKLNDNYNNHQAKQYSHYQYQRRQGNPPNSGGYTTLGHPDRRPSYQQALGNTGPAKPARTYAKALNRSRSFSVHGMNGSTDPSPVYMEKLNRQNYNNNNNKYNNNSNYHINSSNLHASQAYKSNPHLYSGPGVNKESTTTMLKSPSIVNLISRSQRDLSKIGVGGGDNEVETSLYYYKNKYPSAAHNRIMDDYADIRKPSQYQLRAKHSLPVELNKDTASIVRPDNSDILMYRDENKLRRGSGATIIELRHK